MLHPRPAIRTALARWLGSLLAGCAAPPWPGRRQRALAGPVDAAETIPGYYNMDHMAPPAALPGPPHPPVHRWWGRDCAHQGRRAPG